MFDRYIEDTTIENVLLTIRKDYEFYVIIKRKNLKEFMKLDMARYVIDITEYVL